MTDHTTGGQPSGWNPTEALYAFCGWLKSRQSPTVISSTDDAGVVYDRIAEFQKRHGLPECRDGMVEPRVDPGVHRPSPAVYDPEHYPEQAQVADDYLSGVREPARDTKLTYRCRQCCDTGMVAYWDGSNYAGEMCPNPSHDAPAETPAAQEQDKSRCAICGWPLMSTVENGCVRGNCSMRPLPKRYYDAERARKEYGVNLPAEEPPTAAEKELTALRAEHAHLRQQLEKLQRVKQIAQTEKLIERVRGNGSWFCAEGCTYWHSGFHVEACRFVSNHGELLAQLTALRAECDRLKGQVAQLLPLAKLGAWYRHQSARADFLEHKHHDARGHGEIERTCPHPDCQLVRAREEQP